MKKIKPKKINFTRETIIPSHTVEKSFREVLESSMGKDCTIKPVSYDGFIIYIKETNTEFKSIIYGDVEYFYKFLFTQKPDCLEWVELFITICPKDKERHLSSRLKMWNSEELPFEIFIEKVKEDKEFLVKGIKNLTEDNRYMYLEDGIFMLREKNKEIKALKEQLEMLKAINPIKTRSTSKI